MMQTQAALVDDAPLVSVIIPNYRHAPYLKQRIDSVLNQSYQNIELIILDDKSPDNSVEVIEQYRSHPKVAHIVINEQNSGSTFIQWQRGFDLARGEYIWLAESDDYCEPTFLETCLRARAGGENTAIVYATSQLVDSQGEYVGPEDVAASIPAGRFNGREFISRYMSFQNAIWNASAVLFRRDFALNANPRYKEYVAAGDHLFWVELAEQGDVVHIGEKLNYFRQHQQKVTPAKYRSGVTHEEELRTLRYMWNRGLLTCGCRKEALKVYLSQIRAYEYDSEDIRAHLMETIHSELGIAYYIEACKSYAKSVLHKIKSTFLQ